MENLPALNVDTMFSDHIRKHFDEHRTAELHNQFEEYSIVPLRGLCPPDLLDPLLAEANQLMANHGQVRDIKFKLTDYTPRNMTTVGQPIIEEWGGIIPAIYDSPEVRRVISEVVGESLYTCPYAGERYVVSRLERSGDTHGWHWDDYSLGVIWVLEAPDPKDGGFVQCVPNTSWNKEDPQVHKALLQSPIYSYALQAGDAYVLKTSTTMHRVYPISEGSRRTIINMVWANKADLDRPMTHETNDALFTATA